MMKLSQMLAAALLAFAASSTAFADDGQMTDEAIAERIKPVGEVYTSEDLPDVAVASSASDGPRDGVTVYNQVCAGCHSIGAAGAPKTGDKAAWADRLAQGADTLHKHALEGFKTMPAKGGCASCLDEEIVAAVDYLIEQAQ